MPQSVFMRTCLERELASLPQGTVPISLMVISYRPDIVIHHVTSNSIALLELTCPLDSNQHLEAARDHK